MTGIVEFIEARITEDEEVAAAAKAVGWHMWEQSDFGGWKLDGDYTRMLSEESAQLSRWDPARVLAECAAKRLILALHGDDGQGNCEVCTIADDDDPDSRYPEAAPCVTVRALAAPWSEHPDFDPSWALGEQT